MFSCRLVIEKVSVSDEGNYICRASNDLSLQFSNWVEVSVHQPAHGMAFPVVQQLHSQYLLPSLSASTIWRKG